MFDENSLRAEIVNKWGAHGAHVEVFDMLRAEAELWEATSRKHCEEAVRVEGENLELQRKNDALQGALVDSRAEVGRLEKALKRMDASWVNAISELMIPARIGGQTKLMVEAEPLLRRCGSERLDILSAQPAPEKPAEPAGGGK